MQSWSHMVKGLLSPSLRYELRHAAGSLRSQLSRSCLWRWEVVRVAPREVDGRQVVYFGRRSMRASALLILGMDEKVEAAPCGAAAALRLKSAAIASEAPFPGAFRVPRSLHAIVPLGRPVEELVASYDGELRRRLRKQRAVSRTRQILDDAEIERVNREMLAPYGTARHGDGAVNLPLGVVRKMARGVGRLDVVCSNEVEIACHLGLALTRRGRRYWVTRRFGYPEAVFSDSKRLREANSINTYLALEWAVENGFDFYDMGGCVPRPDDGLLQWKRRRGGAVGLLENEGFFYVRPPRHDPARFLWDVPLFSVERDRLSLRLGLPVGPSDEEAASRYHEMGFGGLATAYLYCARPPGEKLVTGLRRLYEGRSDRTELRIVDAS